jgi:hypothetical protein
LSSQKKELPRSVRKGPPITITCECGRKRELKYGEAWSCEGCGRRYDTTRIPMDDYARFHRNRVRDRILPSALLAVAVGLVVLFVAIGRPLAAVVIVPMIGFAWGSFIRPRRRERQYKTIAERPTWQIKAE